MPQSDQGNRLNVTRVGWLAGMVFAALGVVGDAWAMEGYSTNVRDLCVQNGRPEPVFPTIDCLGCHNNPDPRGSGDISSTPKGLVYAGYLAAPPTKTKTQVLNTFCPSATAADTGTTFYNATDYESDASVRISIPATWMPTPSPAVNYTGSLDAYWLARLTTNNQSLTISRDDAVSRGAPVGSNLWVAPDNCWGMDMGFGLVTLSQASDLMVTVSADGSNIIPAFALYKGWDSGKGATRHTTIIFGGNNPLGTSGLTYVGDIMGSVAGGSVTKSFSRLAAGNYEIFVTVGSNKSSGGQYKVQLTTSPSGSSTQYALSVSNGGNGTVTSSPAGISCGATCAANYDSGTTVALSATPNAGYSFSGWGGACSGSGACTVSMSAAKSVTASFVPVTYALTVTNGGNGSVVSNPSGIDCGSNCSASYSNGTQVTLTANPASGYRFSGWGGACSGTGSCKVAMTAARTVSASFSAQAPTTHVLSVTGGGNGVVTSAPAGINCGAACASSFQEGTVVELTATANAGYSFSGWGGDCSGSGTCVVSMTAARSVTASFSQTPVGSVDLTVTRSGQGRVTSSPAGIDCGAQCTRSFTQGAAVTLTATADSGYRFERWGGACSGSAASCSLSMTDEKSVTATFTPVAPAAYALTVSHGGHGRVSSAPAGIDCGAVCSSSFEAGTSVVLTAEPEAGYLLAGWGGQCSGTSPTCPVVMNGARSVSATFAAVPVDQATLQVNKTGMGTLVSSPAGIDCGPACSAASAAFERSRSVTLNATPAEGYSFTGWGGDCAGAGPCTVTMEVDRSVTGIFEQVPTPVVAVCGDANNQPASRRPAEGSLCQVGAASKPVKLGDGRYNWTCATAESRVMCYTLTAKGQRENQAPLVLSPGDVSVTSGAEIIEEVTGGSGAGKVTISKQGTTRGAKCKLGKLVDGRVTIRTAGTGGSCVLVGKKAKSAGYNAVKSAPVTITVLPK